MYIVDLCLIDFDLSEGRFLQLEHAEKIEITEHNFNSMGFLPNGDLIIVSEHRPYKIYRYSVENKPTTNTTFWKCSQIYDIELSESLKDYYYYDYNYFFVYQTKLFFINTRKRLMFQWNLSTMTFDMQYFLVDIVDNYLYGPEIVINKNQTLLALNIFNSYTEKHRFYVFSMETGTFISKYG